MKVRVDTELCTGCGLCADSCPEIFELDNDYATVKVDVVPEDQEDCARQAVEDCPVEAISIEE